MNTLRNKLTLVVVLALCSAALGGYTSASKFLDQPKEWYTTAEARQMAASVLSYQTPEGGWPKNMETAVELFTGDTSTLHPTFDNGATMFELMYLAKMVTNAHDEKCLAGFNKGLDYILGAQYPTGGWPQAWPPKLDGKQMYQQYITFNDGAMIRLMFFLRDTMRSSDYAFIDAPRRDAIQHAYDRGIDCILKCQIKVDGKLTAWCAQHDEKDLSPRGARTFELPSISGCETIGIVHLLMTIEKPSPEVITSIDSAMAWLDSVKIPGIRVEDRKQEGTPHGIERVVVHDPSAPPMWARFYEIGTNRPIYAGRDGVKHYDLSEIDIERRTGYQWLKYWPKNLIEKEYPAWKARVSGTPATQP